MAIVTQDELYQYFRSGNKVSYWQFRNLVDSTQPRLLPGPGVSFTPQSDGSQLLNFDLSAAATSFDYFVETAEDLVNIPDNAYRVYVMSGVYDMSTLVSGSSFSLKNVKLFQCAPEVEIEFSVTLGSQATFFNHTGCTFIGGTFSFTIAAVSGSSPVATSIFSLNAGGIFEGCVFNYTIPSGITIPASYQCVLFGWTSGGTQTVPVLIRFYGCSLYGSLEISDFPGFLRYFSIASASATYYPVVSLYDFTLVHRNSSATQTERNVGFFRCTQGSQITIRDMTVTTNGVAQPFRFSNAAKVLIDNLRYSCNYYPAGMLTDSTWSTITFDANYNLWYPSRVSNSYFTPVGTLANPAPRAIFSNSYVHTNLMIDRVQSSMGNLNNLLNVTNCVAPEFAGCFSGTSGSGSSPYAAANTFEGGWNRTE